MRVCEQFGGGGGAISFIRGRIVDHLGPLLGARLRGRMTTHRVLRRVLGRYWGSVRVCERKSRSQNGPLRRLPAPSQRPSQSAIFLSELRALLPLIVLPLEMPAKIRKTSKIPF